MTMERAPDDNRPRPSLIANISWLGTANVIVKPFWFLFVTAACMRLLGVQEYGVMNAALSLTLIAVSMTNLGTTRFTVREVARDPSRASLFFSNFIVLLAGGAIIAWIGAVLIGRLLGYGPEAQIAVAFAGLYAVSLGLTGYCRSLYESLEALRQESIMLIVEKVLVIGLGLTGLVLTRTAYWTLAGMGAGMALTLLLNIWWINRRHARLDRSLISRRFIVGALKTMIPFGLAELFIVIYFRVDMVMIEAMLGEGPTGQYGAAYRIHEALSMLPAIVASAAVYPRLARLQGSGSNRAFLRLLGKSAAGLVATGTVITVGVFLTAPTIISLLDPDPQYGPAAGALAVLVWAFPFSCASALLYAALVSIDDQRFISWLLLGALALNISMNLVLIPLRGIEGAALATVLPEILLTAAFTWRLLVRWKGGKADRFSEPDE